MQLDARKYLFDVLTACDAILGFIRDRDFTEYEADLMLRSAVERQLMIVGEALNKARRLDETVAQDVPEARDIIQLRNIVARGYAVVENATIWGIVQAHVPKLRERVKTMLAGQ
jgi:uncharacterized protein with HEPN domain